jgi:3-carboxy-cis,cis-muconate cycloisomerase
LEQGGSLFEVLAANPVVGGALPTDRLRALCDPTNYLGSAAAMVDAIVRRPRGT